MERTIKMRGDKVRYDEVRPRGVPDDGRLIDMDGREVVYREMAGVESIEEQVVEAVVPRMGAAADEVQVVVEAQAALPGAPRPLPAQLSTPQAMVYWQRLRAAGFVDDNCQLLPTTSRRQACDIVDMFAQRVGAERHKWKLFEDLWGKKNLAQDWSRLQAARLVKKKGWKPRRYDEIEDIFGQPV